MLDFLQHVPGHPYELGPIQFFNFLGLGHSFRRAQNQDLNPMTKSRLYEILPKYKGVRIRTESEIWWEYKTESKTIFHIKVINGKIRFFVTIPANRDREGRQHYTDIRIGNPYDGRVFQK